MAYARANPPKSFQTMLRSEMEEAINQANLGQENTEIAKLYLIDHLPQVDIAAELGYERSTITHRMRHIIRRVEQTAQKISFT